MFKKAKCPICGREELIEIIYGYPSNELFELSEKGLVKLGGCCLPINYDDNIKYYYCKSCRKEIKMANKDNKNLFRYMLKDTYGIICHEDILIVDSKEDNVILNPKLEYPLKFSINYDDILKIKNIINNNPYLFKIKEVPIPEHILDGSRNEMIFWNGRVVNSFETCNLWYWNKENCKSRNVKTVLKIFNEIAEILKKYEIDLSLN